MTGINTVTVTITLGGEEVAVVYTVIVTKSGTLGALTVTSETGTETGDTTISVDETLTTGCSYKYKTAASVDVPELDDDLTEWDDWDGESDITATNGHDIVIAVVNSFDNLCKAAGEATVVSNTGD